MESEAVSMPSALFGADGTELPDPLPVLPDPLTGPEHSAWRDIPDIAPVPLPPLPDGRAMRAAIAAVLADDPAAQPGGAAWNLPAPPMPAPPVTVPRVPVAQRAPAPAGPHRTFAPPPADLRRRVPQDSAGRLQSRSSGGVRTGCIIALIIIGVVAFYLIAGIVQSVAALFS